MPDLALFPADPPSETAAPAQQAGPGALHGDVVLTLNTRHAFRVFEGRQRRDEKPAIPGLYHFASYLDQIAVGIEADDPYADWTMVRIDHMLETCEQALLDRCRSARTRLEAAPGLAIGIASSIDPEVIPLTLRLPYTHWAARLIGVFDEMVATLLSGQYVGIVDTKQVREGIDFGSNAMRRVFHAAQSYRFSGATRVDIEQANARAHEAIEKHGRVPDEILRCEVQPRFTLRVKRH